MEGGQQSPKHFSATSYTSFSILTTCTTRAHMWRIMCIYAHMHTHSSLSMSFRSAASTANIPTFLFVVLCHNQVAFLLSQRIKSLRAPLLMMPGSLGKSVSYQVWVCIRTKHYIKSRQKHLVFYLTSRLDMQFEKQLSQMHAMGACRCRILWAVWNKAGQHGQLSAQPAHHHLLQKWWSMVAGQGFPASVGMQTDREWRI